MSAVVATVVAVFVLAVGTALVRSVRVVPQATSAVVERLGRFQRVLEPGLNVLMPVTDRIRARIDLREQVISFPPQPVITADNVTVNIDTVVYVQVTDPRAATYEIENYLQAVEQLTMTTLRNVVGGMHLEETLTSRDAINTRLRGELDQATGRWGIRVGRVELRAIEPPASIQNSMEKQMRAERDKRAMILQAEGTRESAIRTAEGERASRILTAEGDKQSTILAAQAEKQSLVLRAEGERAAAYLRAQGQAKAVETVFAAVHDADPDPKMLAYQYLQTLPRIAEGDANKVWIMPSEFSAALRGLVPAPAAEPAPETDPGGARGAEGSGGDQPRSEAPHPVSWLVEAGSARPSPAARRPDHQPIDTSSWFDTDPAPPAPPEAADRTRIALID